VVRDAARTAGHLRATAPEPPSGQGVAQILPFPLLHRAPASAVEAPEDGAGRRETVLVIDAEDALAPLLRAELSGRAQVEHAASPDSVLRALAAWHVGVVVFSFDVQSEADLGFLQLLKRERPFMLVIAVCGSADTVRLIELINQAKIFRFMRRPAAPRVLAHHVASAIKLMSETRRDPRWLQLQQPEQPTAAAVAAGPQDGAARPVPRAVQTGLWSRVATWLRTG
jgi:DNA-binding NarL/FixJ family response regulator